MIREYFDPNFTATLDVTSHGNTSSLDLTIGDPCTFQCLQMCIRDSLLGKLSIIKLALFLFMLWIFANHHYITFTTNDLAFFAFWFYRSSNLHVLYPPYRKKTYLNLYVIRPRVKSYEMCIRDRFISVQCWQEI